MVLTAQSRADQALGGEAVLSETVLSDFSMHQARTWRCSARLPMTRSHWSAATYSRARSLGSAHHSALHSVAAEAVTCSSGPQEAAPDTCVRSPGTRAPWPGMGMLMDTCHAHGALWPRAELRREGGHGEGGAGARGHEPGQLQAPAIWACKSESLSCHTRGKWLSEHDGSTRTACCDKRLWLATQA